MTAEVRWKIMQSKDGDKQQKCMDFLRRSRAPSHYGHLTISEAAKERRDRCRGDLRSSAAAEHEVRGREERTVADKIIKRAMQDGAQ
jgi:hypothetical protein